MNKEIQIQKISNYDKFKCTADKCAFTCCEGWDVNVDTATYNKWKRENDKAGFILDNVKTKKCGSKTKYFINKENHEACPLLDEKGLCQVVKSIGEEYLSSICHKFPRIENIFEDKKEFTLSCACPEVVELISTINGKIEMISEENINSNLFELKVRDTIINIIREENFLLDEKLIVAFQMLLSILEDENSIEENSLEELEIYNNREYLQELIGIYKEIECNKNDSIEEINYLFLDIIKNYKEVPKFDILLKDISNFAENIQIASLSVKWDEYKSSFEEYNNLIENCIISDILSSCVSQNIEEMTISFQMIALEYLLVRYAVFLKYCINENKEIDIKDIKNYIVVFSRIIGNNIEAVKEFIRDGFGEDILEIGYLCFIALL